MKQSKLGFWSLFFMLAGTMIGPSICIYIGYTMGATGYSAWLCIIFAMALGVLLFFPMRFMAKYVNLRGGVYSVVACIGGKIPAGIYAYSGIINYMTITTMALGAAAYICSVFPDWNATLVAFVILTAICALNLVDIKAIARAQSGMTILLVACLLSLFVVGIFKMNQPVFDFSGPQFFANGLPGFITGIGLLATMGQTCQYATALTDVAEDPKRNVPKIMVAVPAFLVVFYLLVTWVAEGVLPMDQVAGQGTLAPQLFYVFGSTVGLVLLIAGPVLALLTSINGFYVSVPAIMMTNARNGWYPQAMSKRNRFGAPGVSVIVLYAICVIPLLFGIDIVSLTQWSLIMGALVYYIMIYCFFRFPTQFKDVIEKSDIPFNKTVYYIFCGLSFAAETFFLVYSLTNLDTKWLPGCLVMCAVAIGVAVAVTKLRKDKIELGTSITVD